VDAQSPNQASAVRDSVKGPMGYLAKSSNCKRCRYAVCGATLDDLDRSSVHYNIKIFAMPQAVQLQTLIVMSIQCCCCEQANLSARPLHLHDAVVTDSGFTRSRTRRAKILVRICGILQHHC